MRTTSRWLVGWLVPIFMALATAGVARADLVVHEWGTFTTHHGLDGEPYVWRPLTVVSDLPRFVNRAKTQVTQKNTYPGTVRMETPVLYFYGDRQTVSVDVKFPSGIISEWYPRGRYGLSAISWPRVAMLPGASAPLRREASPSHYYPARETDGAMLRCRTNRGAQHEKFLFYRGVGTFETPVRIRLDGDLVQLAIVGPDPVTGVFLFERIGDAVGMRAVDVTGGAASVERPTPSTDAIATLETALHGRLVAEGLYPREAQAMLETWRNTWSEPGLRALYVVPRRLTDEVLPLSIKPTPSSLVRVLIGRAEYAPAPDA